MREPVLFVFTCLLFVNVNAQPALQWAKQLVVSGDINAYCNPLGLTEDIAGDIISVGFFCDSADLDPGAGTYYVTSGQGMQTGYIMKQNAAGTFLWGMEIAGQLSRVFNVVTDDSCNIYVSGCFLGVCDFDPGPGSYILNGHNDFDGFIAKYSPAGSLIWVDEIESASIEGAAHMIMDAQGDLILIGRFIGTIDFDPGAGTFNLTGNGPYAADYYIAKFSTNDQLIWAGMIAPVTQGAIYMRDVDTDQFGNIYVCGRYSGTTATDFDPGPGQALMLGGTPYHSFLLKLNATGNFLWSKQTGNATVGYSDYDRIEIGPDNRVNLIGEFQDTMDLDPGAGISIDTAHMFGSMYLCKLDTSGNLIWVSMFATGTYNAFSAGRCLAVDENGWLYISGAFFEGTDFDPGPGVVTFPGLPVRNQIFCAYDSTGALVWATSLVFSIVSWIGDLEVSHGEIIIAGSFIDTMNFAIAPGSYPMMAAVGQNGYICRYDDTLLSVHENTRNTTVVFPNPSSGTIHVHSEKKLAGIFVYDMSGRLVFTETLQSPMENATLQLQLSPGTYVLKCIDGGGNVSAQRFILTR